MLVHDQGDRDTGGAQPPGQRNGAVQFRASDRTGGGLLREHPAHTGRPQGVELGIERLTDSRRAGVTDPHMPGLLRSGRSRARQFDPHRCGLAQRRSRDGERFGERGHQTEPGGVVLDGDLALAGPAR